MKRYLRNMSWDWALCTCSSVGLLFHIYAGFVLEDPYSGNIPVVFAFAGALTFLLALAAYSKASAIVGVCMGVAVILAYLIHSRGNNPFADETTYSTEVFLALTVLTCVMVFLAARTRAGIVSLFVVGSIVMGGSAFLQFPVQVWGLLLFLFSTGALYLYRVYRNTLLRVFAGKIRIARYMVQALCVCLAAFLLAGGIFMAVIRPLSPPVQDLKLITRLQSMELFQVLGVATTKMLLDPSLRASGNVEGTLYGSQPGEKEDEKESGGEGSGGQEQGQDGSQGDALEEETEQEDRNEERDPDKKQESVPVWYEVNDSKIAWGLILLVVAAVLLPLLRVMSRKRWYRAVCALDRESAVLNFYQFFCEKLAICGCRKPENFTLYEYARNMEHELQPFAQGEGTFSRLTQVYARVLYGRCAVTEEEYRMFTEFYGSFYKNLRRESGMFRYLVRWFRL